MHVLAKLTSMTNIGALNIITLDKRESLERRHSILTRVSKPLVPEINVGGNMQGGGWITMRGARKRVEIPFTIAAKDHATSLQVLHRKTKRVKLNRATIVTSKLANREKIAN